jgi:hypothetical protein
MLSASVHSDELLGDNLIARRKSTNGKWEKQKDESNAEWDKCLHAQDLLP